MSTSTPATPDELANMSLEALARAIAAEKAPRRDFCAPVLPHSVIPRNGVNCLASDSAVSGYEFLNGGSGFCGLGFPGYSYLSELAQRTEYRAPAETMADEMTREGIKFEGASDAENKELMDAWRDFGVTPMLHQTVINDMLFGRAQTYIDIKGTSITGRANPLLIEDKANLKGKLVGFKTVEPIWSTPQSYNSSDPTKPNFYKPDSWYLQGIRVHATRLMTFIARPLPDILKPAYNFSGMSMSQLIEPYVVRWLKTVDSVNRLISNFSTSGIAVNMTGLMADNGAKMLKRLQAMTLMRDNRGILMLDKATEEFFQQNIPLGGLADLQQQALEHMAYPTHLPLIKLTGSTPAGLNATGEGEIKVLYDHVGASQENFFEPHATGILKLIQLHLWGTINDKIKLVFVPLDTPTDKELSEKRKADGATDTAYVNAAVVSPDEVRTRLRNDPTSGYGFLTGEAPTPPMDAEHALGEESADNAHERSEESADNAHKREMKASKMAQDAWSEAQHPRDPNGKFGSGSSRAEVFTRARAKQQELQDAEAEAGATLGEFDKHRAAGSATMGGLLPDAVKASSEYKDARAKHANAFATLRNYNAKFVPEFKKELSAERDARRAAKLKESQS